VSRIVRRSVGLSGFVPDKNAPPKSRISAKRVGPPPRRKLLAIRYDVAFIASMVIVVPVLLGFPTMLFPIPPLMVLIPATLSLSI